MKYRSWLKLGLITPLLLAVLAEAGLRLAGVIDFPVYDTDEVIGYIPAPNQRGEFLNRNRWQINERSMGSEHWHPHGQRDLLRAHGCDACQGYLYAEPLTAAEFEEQKQRLLRQ